MRYSRIILSAAAILALPFLASAQTDTTNTVTATADYSSTYAFQKDGVFGCNLNGAYSMSVGSLSATGGAYVPVNDAAVTLNTGYLVYKECVLRGIVDRQREGVTSALTKQMTVVYTSGRNGQAQFLQSIPQESTAFWTKSVVNSLQGSTLSAVNPAFKASIQRAIAQGYSASINARAQSLACPYTGDLKALETNPTQSFSWAGLASLMNPNCLPYFAAIRANGVVMGDAASGWNDQMTQVGWGNGTYPVQTVDENGNIITVTPGAIVSSNIQQALQTGFRQLENANDIDQMVGALFAGITSQVTGDNRGLIGLTQRTGSQASYLDQVASESAAGIRNSALNAAITILGANRTIEQGYLAAMQAIGTVLTNTINSLRSKENICWNAIIQNVCTSGTLKSDNTCTAVAQGCTTDAEGVRTCPSAITLKIATSTVFSQAIVDGQITPLANATVANINSSNTALTLINQLLTGVTNTTSLDAQRIALQQLDTLVSQHKLHTQYDQQAAEQSKTTITGSMTQLLSDTVANWTGAGSDGTANAAWDGTTYPAVGWCNVSNQTTIQAWIQKWKK
ncbi:MAG: hypothetical protein JWM46_511 [Candidatus Kaiserbacteria bacterium]|nr:hypothetical protein [Candidatus Kaiserbacteria bacterium]